MKRALECLAGLALAGVMMLAVVIAFTGMILFRKYDDEWSVGK